MSQEDSPTADKASVSQDASEKLRPSQSSETNSSATKSGASLSRLTAAFANMMGTTSKSTAGKEASKHSVSEPATIEAGVTSRGIIEAILFVGLPYSDSEVDPNSRPDPNGQALPAETIAGAMRDVSVEEVAKEIETLNEQYEEDGSPYRIELSSAGYRMVLRDQFHPLRDRFHGRIRTAKLTPAALEVLSIVAYQQPISTEEISDLRDERSATAISQLVRRGLLEQAEELTDMRTDEPHAKSEPPKFRTTERFLKILELEALNQLPQVTEHDD